MRLVVVTGMPGSGKEEFLSAAAEAGIPFVRMGDVVREHHSASGEGTVGEFAGEERRRHGFDIWARRSLERMSGPVFLVDGCRSMAEVEAFRGLAGDVRVVAIHAPPAARYGRLVARGREDAPSSPEEFRERDRREIGWGIAEVIALSDVMIVNDGPLDSFRRAAKEVLEGMR